MELTIYIEKYAVKHFPSMGRMARQCVRLHATRTGPDVVRWVLTGPADALTEYAGIARDLGLRYEVACNTGR